MAFTNVGPNLRNGIIGSLLGGIVFGMLMTMMDMMGMVAMLVRSDNIIVGWVVHLVISTIFGVVFGFLLSLVRFNPIITGLGWGMMAWVGGALVMMPLFLGMPEMVFNFSGSTPWYSLMGHMMYGLVAGLYVYFVNRRSGTSTRGRATA